MHDDEADPAAPREGTATSRSATADPQRELVRDVAWEDVATFVRDDLMSPARTQPIVCLTSRLGGRGFPMDAHDLARRLGSAARVVRVETGAGSRALDLALPQHLGVYGGAARIWWPGLNRDSDPWEHPLILMHLPADLEHAMQRIPDAIAAGPRRAVRKTTALVPTEPGGLPPDDSQPTGTIIAIQGDDIRVESRGLVGSIREADEPLAALALRLRLWQEIPVRLLDADAPDSPPQFSTRGLLAGEQASDAHPSPFQGPVLHGTVLRVEAGVVRVVAGELEGPIVDADKPLEDIAAHVVAGEPLLVRRTEEPGGGGPAFTLRGIGQSPWLRVGHAYKVGDVVRGRVTRVDPGYLLIEVLPGAKLLAPAKELDWGHTSDVGALFVLGECVSGKILTLDLEQRRGTISIRQAYGSALLPALSPAPGEPPFLGDAVARSLEPRAVAEQQTPWLSELGGAVDEQGRLQERLKAYSEQVAELKKLLRGAEERLRQVTQRGTGERDPSASATAFLTVVRVEYARRFEEGDRCLFPLQRMRVGARFLESLRALEGIAMEKIVEVCAQVASLRAHQIPAREVHPLRSGEAGAPSRARARDGAKAWRCSLQDNTASARRLHWWDIPGDNGRTIEFASVAVHDDMSIPE